MPVRRGIYRVENSIGTLGIPNLQTRIENLSEGQYFESPEKTIPEATPPRGFCKELQHIVLNFIIESADKELSQTVIFRLFKNYRPAWTANITPDFATDEETGIRKGTVSSFEDFVNSIRVFPGEILGYKISGVYQGKNPNSSLTIRL
jgi:hypothetical protein